MHKTGAIWITCSRWILVIGIEFRVRWQFGVFQGAHVGRNWNSNSLWAKTDQPRPMRSKLN